MMNENILVRAAMVYDSDMIRSFYSSYGEKVREVRKKLNRPLTLTEKICYIHLFHENDAKNYRRGEDYVRFRPDRVAMQDATAQMALLQFMNAGKATVAVPTTVHCDHLIQAVRGVDSDLPQALEQNKEVYTFLKDASSRYGIGFWKPGAGIIHQVVLENYAFPGGMMVGTDSHTPNAGGLGMLAIGVGGADAVDVMAGMEWELRMPRLIGVHLTGKMSGWVSPKDVILKLAGMLTVKGGTNAVLEYFGEGTSSLSATGKATICNMGAEVGATSSLFPYDRRMADYLKATDRTIVADWAETVAPDLRADDEVFQNPDCYYDQVIEINLSELEPYVNGPFTPDAATPISQLAGKVKACGYPETVEVGLIGSCTNSSYQDLQRAASIARQVREKKIMPQAKLVINPGSDRVKNTAERDGLFFSFEGFDVTVMSNACGPCIGQWKRTAEISQRRNSIVTSFNRNFSKRADGNPNTHAFVTSPEIVMALSIAGNLCFNPLKDNLVNREGKKCVLDEPEGDDLPRDGFTAGQMGYLAPKGGDKEIWIDPHSSRLQRLQPFTAWKNSDFTDMRLLVKVKGKCTTDHISMAGPWLRFRGHLENISDNMLMGAINAFTGQTNQAWNELTGEYGTVSSVAKIYKQKGISSVIVAEDNYGEGSSREHAAMEPRYLNVKVVLAKSFARIHETNLKKQGILALTFTRKDDYALVQEHDRMTFPDIAMIEPGKDLSLLLTHLNGDRDVIRVAHTYNRQQIGWLKAGSALNAICNGKD